MAEVKLTFDGDTIIVSDADVVDGFVVLKWGQYETRIPVEVWEKDSKDDIGELSCNNI